VPKPHIFSKKSKSSDFQITVVELKFSTAYVGIPKSTYVFRDLILGSATCRDERRAGPASGPAVSCEASDSEFGL